MAMAQQAAAAWPGWGGELSLHANPAPGRLVRADAGAGEDETGNGRRWRFARPGPEALEAAAARLGAALEAIPPPMGHARASLLAQRATALMRRRAWAAAADDWSEVLLLEPGDADAAYGRGVAREKLGQLQDAIVC